MDKMNPNYDLGPAKEQFQVAYEAAGVELSLRTVETQARLVVDDFNKKVGEQVAKAADDAAVIEVLREAKEGSQGLKTALDTRLDELIERGEQNEKLAPRLGAAKKMA
jgi:hypothetical protein